MRIMYWSLLKHYGEFQPCQSRILNQVWAILKVGSIQLPKLYTHKAGPAGPQEAAI